MKAITSFLFLVFLIFTGVMVIANMSYTGEFFFLKPFPEQKLIFPFLGFACLGMLTGIFFTLSLRYIFAKKPAAVQQVEDILEEEEKKEDSK